MKEETIGWVPLQIGRAGGGKRRKRGRKEG